MTASRLAVVAAVTSLAACAGLASLVAEAAVPDAAGWVQGEAGLWLSALLAVAVTAAWHTKRGAERTVV